MRTRPRAGVSIEVLLLNRCAQCHVIIVVYHTTWKLTPFAVQQLLLTAAWCGLTHVVFLRACATHQQRAHLQLRPLHVQCDKPRVKTFSLLSADMQHLIEKLIGTCVVSLECRQSLEGSLCIDDDDSKVPT